MEGETSSTSIISEQKLEKKYGQSSVFVTSTLQLLEDAAGTPKGESYVASLFKEAIHVISCGYEAKTEWGKEVSNIQHNAD